jgi:hypothetical protein
MPPRDWNWSSLLRRLVLTCATLIKASLFAQFFITLHSIDNTSAALPDG